MSAIDDYLDNNTAYAAKFSSGDLGIPPTDKIAVVACMDARLDMGALLGLDTGAAHIIRNAGGVVTEDVIRSLAISQCLLGTREIMLVHHTDCGMLGFTDAELEDAIEKETGTRPAFAMKSFSDVEDDLRRSIAQIQASPVIPHKEAIRGFVYQVETGHLREVK